MNRAERRAMDRAERRLHHSPMYLKARRQHGRFYNASALDCTQVRDLQLIGHAALTAITQGKGVEGDIDNLALISNVALVLAEMGLGADLLNEVLQGQQAVISMQERLEQTGRVGASGPALYALNVLLEVHDAQLDIPPDGRGNAQGDRRGQAAARCGACDGRHERRHVMVEDFQNTDGMGFALPQMVTLSNGDTVPSDSLMWREECLQRHRHVENLRKLIPAERRAYVADVAHKEGDESGRRLTEAFGRDYEERRAKEAAARAQVAP